MSYLQILVRAGHQVTFVPFEPMDAGPHTKALRDLGVILHSDEFPTIGDAITALGPQNDILLLFRGALATHVFDHARRVAPDAKIVFHPVDLQFVRTEREAAVTGNADLAHAAAEFRANELGLIQRADAAIVVSAYERELLTTLMPTAPVHQIPILRESHASASPPPDASNRQGIVFIGGFSHTPNADAVRWFVREIWPRLLERGFKENFVVVGSDVPRDIAQLADDRIEIRGHVEDLDSLFAGCRLSVAPLRFGSGVKGKIVTSLSYGVPVVATSIAAEGMQLRDGVDVLLADDPGEMANVIMKACSNPRAWQSLSTNARAAFARQFSHEAGSRKVLAVFDSLLAPQPKQRTTP
jgi:glycosyltransferase involved in cell wall biosynthesis